MPKEIPGTNLVKLFDGECFVTDSGETIKPGAQIVKVTPNPAINQITIQGADISMTPIKETSWVTPGETIEDFIEAVKKCS